MLWSLASREAWRADVLLGGIVVGATVVAGWYVSGHIGYVAEHPETLEEAFIATNSGRAESLTFVAPFAYTLELLMLWSDTSRIVTFGIASALGVIVGAAIHALLSRGFRIESFRDTGDLVRHMLGGLLMGVALAAVQAWPTMSPALKLLLTTGLLGGLTTFSTFSAEAFHLLQRGALGWLGLHVLVHVTGSVLMTWAGFTLFNALRA